MRNQMKKKQLQKIQHLNEHIADLNLYIFNMGMQLGTDMKYKRLWGQLKEHYAGSCLKDASYDEIYGLMETMEHE